MRWWIQQTNKTIFLVFLLLYVLQILILTCYTTATDDQPSSVSMSELVLPGVMLVYLGIIHCQVVSTNFVNGSDNKRLTPDMNKSVRNILASKVATKFNESFTKETPNTEDDLSSDTDQSKDEVRSSSSSLGSRHHLSSYKNISATRLVPGSSSTSNKINVRLWENGRWQKVRASIVDIGSIIMKKAHGIAPESYDIESLMFIFVIPLMPLTYRCIQYQDKIEIWSIYDVTIEKTIEFIDGNSDVTMVIVMAGITIQRILLGTMFFVVLCAAQRTFQRRFFFAKYFTHVTSSRRAKKSELPHFRLKKVQNIMLWLSLRSYLQRRGPQRSIDVIVSSTFLCSIGLLCFITVQLMHSSETFTSSLLYWECLVWLLALAVFLLRFITTGAKINKKYSNTSVLLTEQINLYLQMEKKPHKKESFQRANNVLTLAAKLIKEIETPFNIYGLSMNPILYNITRVVVLSAFSGVISELLGFKLKVSWFIIRYVFYYQSQASKSGDVYVVAPRVLQ
uniref:putative homeodomain transcription factor 1 n=1 Tax=Ciona intestinalis TaxID=7719 RepID=UPI000EF4A9D5|nr:putative homeodomain transcription factor 1 [Ciona intestinalis]|eukprot:XP_026693792.1 putative homeodomain transcription factor 1 [Ciona intestinalis]